MATRPDLLIEVNSAIHVWSYTPAGEHHMTRVWGPSSPDPNGYQRWQLETAVLDPLIHGAAMAGLLIVVRKAREI